METEFEDLRQNYKTHPKFAAFRTALDTLEAEETSPAIDTTAINTEELAAAERIAEDLEPHGDDEFDSIGKDQETPAVQQPQQQNHRRENCSPEQFESKVTKFFL